MRTLTTLTAIVLAATFTLTAAGGVAATPPTFPESYYAAWSPDGKQIAFTSDRLGSIDIFVMNADGTRQRPLVRDATNEWWPTWSPDGNGSPSSAAARTANAGRSTRWSWPPGASPG